VDALLLGLAALACPLGMGLMMWMMMRGSGGHPVGGRRDAGTEQELARLRVEVEQLRRARSTRAPADEHR
jgi:hypothetical protein